MKDNAMWYDKEQIDEIAGVEYDFLLKNRNYARRAKLKKYKRTKYIEEIYIHIYAIGVTILFGAIIWWYMNI